MLSAILLWIQLAMKNFTDTRTYRFTILTSKDTENEFFNIQSEQQFSSLLFMG